MKLLLSIFFSTLLILVLLYLPSCGGTASNGDYTKSSGQLDTLFSTNQGSGFNGSVDTIALQEDGKILVGGRMTQFNGESIGYFLRLKSDGSLDTTFIVGAAFDDSVADIEVQSDGKILVAGSFLNYKGLSAPYLVRLESDGQIDTTFMVSLGTSADAKINDLAVDSSGNIVVGGSFTSFNGHTSAKLFRLSSAGAWDSSFNAHFTSGFNLEVNQIAINSSDDVCVGGSFSTYQSSSTGRIACFDKTGTLKTQFQALLLGGTNNTVRTLKFGVNGDEGLFVGGLFSLIATESQNYFAYLNSDGSFIPAQGYNRISTLTSQVTDLVFDLDGNLLVAGDFTWSDYSHPDRLMRFDGGVEDADFSAQLKNGFNGTIQSLKIQSDGKILVGGEFTAFDALLGPYSSLSRLIRLK